MPKVMIVGAGVAGVTVADELRLGGFDGEIIMASAEPDLPYDKPPLSKQVLCGAWPETKALLRDQVFWDANGIDLRLNAAATGLDPGRKIVLFDSGEAESYDQLVIATGVRARPLPGLRGELQGVHSLRTIADARRLRRDLAPGAAVVVVGGGFIGLEVASSAASLGCAVSIIEALEAPLAGVLGDHLGAAVRQLHEEHGIRLITGTSVVRAFGGPKVEAVQLTDGRLIRADTVVVGVGTVPNSDWITRSSTDASTGILCDEHCRVYGQRSIFAIGDIARRRHPELERHLRVEHWTNAVDHGCIVAHAILAIDPGLSFVNLPYFWSDQLGVKLQFVGSAGGSYHSEIRHPEFRDRSCHLYACDDEVTGALAWNWPAAAGRAKKLLRLGVSPDDFVAQVTPKPKSL